jgi:membrane dipeptidase
MKKTGLVFALFAAASLASAAETLHERAMRLHKSAIIVDTHEDVPEELESKWRDLGIRNTVGHIDIPRWREGGVTAPFLAAYVNAEYARTGGSSKKALEFVDLIHRIVEGYPGDLVFAESIEGIRKAKKDGKIAILIGIEGGHAIENSLGALSSFYRLGVRYMTLTHTNTNDWADSAGNFFSVDFDPKKVAVHDGLTDLGKQVVLEMNRLGMLVDISHVSDKTMADAIAVSRAPVFASHSSCRAISNMPRNMTDEQIKAVAAGGGVVMVNVSSVFLSQKSVDGYLAARQALMPQIDVLRQKYKDDPKTLEAEIKKLTGPIQYPDADWAEAVDHIERVLRLGGPHAAGLGTDFDGITDPPVGLEDVSKLPKLTEELLRRGHSEEEVRGVLGENFLRFWERADAARKSMPARTEPLPFSKPQ